MGVLPDSISGIGSLRRRVRRNPAFDPRDHRGLSPEHVELWDQIGAETSVRQLLVDSNLAQEKAVAFIQQLVLLQAVTLEDTIPLSIPLSKPRDETDETASLGALTPEEQDMLNEDVDLDKPRRRMIIGAARAVRRNDYLELLGVTSHATKRDLKRAYYRLAKRYHPDRYWGRELGSYASLLATIFSSASARVQALSAQNSSSVLPSRRSSERHALPLRVNVHCSSWTTPQTLIAQDVRERGIFLLTEAEARTGDRIDLSIHLRDRDPIYLRGRVTNCRSKTQAKNTGRRPGLGIEFIEGDDGDTALTRYEEIVTMARGLRPRAAGLDEHPAFTADIGDDVPTRPRPRSSHANARRRFARGSTPPAQSAHGAPQSPAIHGARASRAGSLRNQESSTVGIDFGTSYTSIAVVTGGNARLLDWPNGQYAIPSVVAFPNRHETIVGQPARQRLTIDPGHTVASIKRLLARPASDPRARAQLDQSGYESRVSDSGGILIKMWDHEIAVAQLVALVLGAAKENAEQQLDRPVNRTVLTIPVSFPKTSIEVLRAAARLVHMEVIEFIDEPTAAALANRSSEKFGGIVGLFDFGGGTFDFSLVDATAGDLRVLATAGDEWLGGDDFDLAIANAVANQIWRVHGVDLRKRAVDWQQLLFNAERAKLQLSSVERAMLVVPEIACSGRFDQEVRLTRTTCERLWAPLIDRSIKVAMRATRRAGLAPERLSAIYLSGGTSLVPGVRRALADQFSVPVRIGIHPQAAAALGAGLHAAGLDSRLTLPIHALG